MSLRINPTNKRIFGGAVATGLVALIVGTALSKKLPAVPIQITTPDGKTTLQHRCYILGIDGDIPMADWTRASLSKSIEMDQKNPNPNTRKGFLGHLPEVSNPPCESDAKFVVKREILGRLNYKGNEDLLQQLEKACRSPQNKISDRLKKKFEDEVDFLLKLEKNSFRLQFQRGDIEDAVRFYYLQEVGTLLNKNRPDGRFINAKFTNFTEDEARQIVEDLTARPFDGICMYVQDYLTDKMLQKVLAKK